MTTISPIRDYGFSVPFVLVVVESHVVADLLDLAHAMVLGNHERKYWGPDGDLPVLPLDSLQARYYIRVTVSDQPGVLARIAQVLGDQGVSISGVTQKESDVEGAHAELVIMTHRTREQSFRQAMADISGLDVVRQVNSFLRVEG